MKLCIVSGAIDSGKTAYLDKLWHQYEESQEPIIGVLSNKIFHTNNAIEPAPDPANKITIDSCEGYDFLLVPSGEIIPALRLKLQQDRFQAETAQNYTDPEKTKRLHREKTGEQDDWFKYRKFYFNQNAFNKTSRHIKRGISLLKGPFCIVLDEIGPLELCENRGFYPLLNELFHTQKHRIDTLWLSIRPDLVKQFCKDFNTSPYYLENLP